MKAFCVILFFACSLAFAEAEKPPAPPPGWGETPRNEQPEAPVAPKKEATKPSPKEKAAEPAPLKTSDPDEIRKYLKDNGYTPMGDDPFAYKDVKMGKRVFDRIEIIGVLVSAAKDFEIANFTISFYDKDDKLLDTSPIVVSNFKNSTTKTFKIYSKVDTDKVAKFTIQFENGL